MKKCIFIMTISMLAATACMADILYLKDGQALRGDIVSQDQNFIVIETYGGNQETIDRKYVESTIKEDSYSSYRQKMRQGYASGDEWMGDEWIFKFGIDFDGTHETSHSNLFIEGSGNQSLDGTQNVNSGVSISGEYINYDSKNLGYGGGLTIQSARGLADVTGNFAFTPIYALIKLRTAPTRRNHYKYLIGQVGYNFFSGDRDYRGSDGSLDGGLYFGVGAGVALNRVALELLYTEDRGKVRASGTIFDPTTGQSNAFNESGDIRYSKLGLNICFLF